MNNKWLKLWGIPLVLGVLSLAGLISALIGDSAWDVFSWLALGIPLIVIAAFVFFKKEGP